MKIRYVFYFSIICYLITFAYSYQINAQPSQPEPVNDTIKQIIHPTSDTICINNVCQARIYSEVRYAQDPNGNWVNASDVLQITKDSDDLTFRYDGIKGDYSITFETGVIFDNAYYSMSDINQLTDIGFEFPIENYLGKKKYAINITNIEVDKTKIESIVLTYKSHSGFDLSDLSANEKRYAIKSIYYLGFDDLADDDYTIEINKPKRQILIRNITADKFEGNSLYLDPTISLTGGNITEDGEIELYFGSYSRTNTSTDAMCGRYYTNYYFRSYFQYNTSSIPDDSIVSDTDFYNRGSYTYGSSSNGCNINDIVVKTYDQSNQALYNDAGNGTQYVSTDTWCETTGLWQTVDLGTSADSDLQSQLTEDWFAIGIESADTSFDNYKEIYTVESIYDHILYVTYTTTPPNTTQVILNASTENNHTIDNLYCYASGTDGLSSSFTANYIWYRNDIQHSNGSVSGILNNTLSLISTIESGNTTNGDVWNCSIRLEDEHGIEQDWNNATITITSRCNLLPVVVEIDNERYHGTVFDCEL